jgi:hypothetical protein
MDTASGILTQHPRLFPQGFEPDSSRLIKNFTQIIAVTPKVKPLGAVLPLDK